MARKQTMLAFLITFLGALSVVAGPMPRNAIEERKGHDSGSADWPSHLEGTDPLQLKDDLLVRSHDQVDDYFLKRIAATPRLRDELWHPDFSSSANYRVSVRGHRQRLKKMLGLLEAVVEPEATRIILDEQAGRVEEVSLLIEPGFRARALVFFPETQRAHPALIAVPSESETREDFAGVGLGSSPAEWLLTLLRRGVVVAIPMSVERTLDHDLSQLSRGTRMTRRQLLHRLGFVVGRTLVGLEVQQVLALRRFLASLSEVDAGRIGVLGSRQGGMTALYAAAADENFAGAVIVDYFQQREGCWKEPVDRMLYGQLKEFGDAEVAALIAPRPLSVLHSTGGPTSATSVESELKRARRFFQGLQVAKALSSSELEKPLETAARVAGEILGAGMKASASELAYRASRHQIEDSRSRHFRMLHQYLRDLGQKSDQIRKQYWNLSGAGPDERSQRVEALKGELRTLMGVIGEEGVPLNARSRLIEVNDRFVGYEVLVDVVSGVEAWGHLLIPRAIDGSAPVVIAQHGGGGRPSLVTGIGEKTDNPYHNFGSHLASQGYVVFAPMVVVGNRPFPQARDSEHRVVFSINEVLNPKVRRAAALGMMRTSIEQTKLGRIIDFLDSMPFVDKQHIGYYGLSYGGYSVTWMRLTASVISGHFNDWRPKITNERIATSYLRHPDEDFSNWNVLHRFTHVELIAATWPRPVCVEYGERDAVTPPGWFRRAWREVQEHARSWDSVDRVVVDYFDGRHEIHAIGAVDFLDRWLKPDRAAAREDAGKRTQQHGLPKSCCGHREEWRYRGA